MKKLLALLSAACIIATMSVSVFAATGGQVATGGQPGSGSVDSNATNGQVTPPAISDLKKDITSGPKLAAAIDVFVKNPSMFMNAESASTLRSALLAQSGGKTILPKLNNASAIGDIVARAGAETANADLTVNSAAMVGNLLELDMTYFVNGVAAQPEFGVLIAVELSKSMPYDATQTYTWKNDKGMSGIAMPIISNKNIVGFEIVATHFSKYTIGAQVATPNAPTAVAPAKTGADVNVAAVAFMLVSAFALAGVAMVSKKVAAK